MPADPAAAPLLATPVRTPIGKLDGPDTGLAPMRAAPGMRLAALVERRRA